MVAPAIVDVNEHTMKAVADDVRGCGRRAATYKGDVTKRRDIYEAVDRTEKELGCFDIIINNAGIVPAFSHGQDPEQTSVSPSAIP